MDNLFLGIVSSMAMCHSVYLPHDELMSRVTQAQNQEIEVKTVIAFNRRRDRNRPAA
jgi:hypothetical protein